MLLWYEIQGSKCSIAADVVDANLLEQPKNTHTNTNTKLFEISTT
jgi:hypothetical protein